jgi:hypothetical protein
MLHADEAPLYGIIIIIAVRADIGMDRYAGGLLWATQS